VGVDGNRLTTKAFGESRPKASNDTEEGRAINRRVEFKVVN
jgi:OOP family OmpA-OmpF porin